MVKSNCVFDLRGCINCVNTSRQFFNAFVKLFWQKVGVLMEKEFKSFDFTDLIIPRGYGPTMEIIALFICKSPEIKDLE